MSWLNDFRFGPMSRIVFGVGKAREAGSIARELDGSVALVMTDAVLYRLGLTEITISTRTFGPGEARLGPLELKLSEATRLRRLARQAKYKEDQRQLVLPIAPKEEPASFLVSFLRELIPVGSAP